jgi:hypothetical protein
LVVVLTVALGCSACFGSAHPAPKPRPTRFEVTYVPPIGNLMGSSSSLDRPRRHLVRCGARNRALCAALVYYATHGPRTCRQSTWSTPAQFGVRGTLHGRRIVEPVAPICRRSPPMLAAAEGVMFRALAR